jgi:hypothetical protein
MQTHIAERSALFLSVISSNTEAITEGYLHKERRAAAERAESFGGQVFLLHPLRNRSNATAVQARAESF